MNGLARFVDAQDAVWSAVQGELQAGHKRSHWMWFVFPQLKGLGRSATAQHFGLADLQEARDYLAHPVLGPRLRQCCTLLLQHAGKNINAMLGSPDDLKLRSCMTLFEQAAPAEPAFAAVLDAFFGGERDALTLQLLSGSPHA